MGGGSSSQPRVNKQYSFKDKHVDSLFKLLNKSNRLKIPEARRPEEVSKSDNPNYYLIIGCRAPHQELLRLQRYPSSSDRYGSAKTLSKIEESDG